MNQEPLPQIHLIRDTDLSVFAYELHIFAGDFLRECEFNMRSLATNTGADSIAIMGKNHIWLSDALFAYCSTADLYQMISTTEFIGARAFLFHTDRREGGHLYGDVLMMDLDTLRQDIKRNILYPCGVNIERKDGSAATVSLKEWTEMELYEKDALKSWGFSYAPNQVTEWQYHYSTMFRQWMDQAFRYMPQDLEERLNMQYMEAAQNPDMDKYRIPQGTAKHMLQGFSDMLTEDDEKEDIVVFVPKGKNAESYKDIAKEEIDSLTQNAEELRVVYKEYSGREQFYYLNSNREEAIDGLSRATNPIVIYQANEAVALNGSYIETGTYNGEVIYGCDESTIRNAAKKYAEQLGSHYFMLTNVGEDYIYSHSFLVKLISFISSLCVLVLLLDIAIIVSEAKMEFRLSSMEISLKKVLGYSFYERHKRFISVNLLENIAVVILICIVSLFISNASVGIALLVGALLTIIEMAIIFTNVMWVEKTNISKSLKGGCL